MDPHRRRRWLFFILSILIGLAAGLYYGWVVRPVRYTDTSPDTLRQDYKTDFVLMVAEAWEATGDLDMARRYLALLGGKPEDQVAQALTYAQQVGYAPRDLHRMRSLLQALRGPQGEATP